MTAQIEQSAIPGFNVLLMGPAGTGKTHSIGTLVDSGVEVFFLALESGMESLMGYYTDQKKEIPANLHWHRLKAPQASFLELMDAATKINTLSLDSIAKMQDPNRGKHNSFISLLTALNDFPDDRTGQKFGAVNSWGPSRALVIDGLTGIGQAAMSLVIGGKPVRNQSDWGIAQDQVEKLLRMLCDACACHFVLLSHVEREVDAVLGGTKLMTATLGKALAPKIPSMFSDVILAVRQGTKWNWDTASAMADVKTRNLPIAGDVAPSFGAIVAKWKSRGGVM
jgi:hypothetical protein